MQHSVDDAKSGPCVDCGVSYPSLVMDFAHVRDVKKYAVSVMSRSGFSPASIALAIAKCDLVCSNCRRERTHALGHNGDHLLPEPDPQIDFVNDQKNVR